MNKNLILFKKLHQYAGHIGITASNLLIGFAILFSASFIAKAQNNVFNFGPTNFTVVDITANRANGFQSSFITNVGGNPNRYQLTDVFYDQTVAMWYKTQQLDLSQDFEFNFRLYFGNGRPHYYGIADGFVFVMHTLPVTNTLIGGGNLYIGYGGGIGIKGITSSFAVEFDTEFNGLLTEGGSVNYGSKEEKCHTAYLKNGNMAALSGTFAPMQDNFATVRNDNILVKIEWKRTNGINGNLGYDLITMIEDKVSGLLVERNSMHFSSLGDLIAGLSEQNPYVTWGITSATCDFPNRHEIEFLSLDNKYSKIEINLVEYCCPEIDSKYDSLFKASIFPNDTLRNSDILCLLSNKPYYIEIDGIDMSNALWSIHW